MDHPLLVHVGQPVGDPLEDPQQLGHPLQRELVHRLAGDVLDEELGLLRAGEPPALDLQAVHLHQVRVVEHLAHAVLVLRLLQVLQVALPVDRDDLEGVLPRIGVAADV